MAEEDFDLASYKDISELKRELEGIKAKKDVSPKELYDAVQALAKTIAGMLEVFGAAAEQMKLEEREAELSAKKYEAMAYKLDKMIDQNKTIAEGMLAIVDMVKKNIISARIEKERCSLPIPGSRPQPNSRLEFRGQCRSKIIQEIYFAICSLNQSTHGIGAGFWP